MTQRPSLVKRDRPSSLKGSEEEEGTRRRECQRLFAQALQLALLEAREAGGVAADIVMPSWPSLKEEKLALPKPH